MKAISSLPTRLATKQPKDYSHPSPEFNLLPTSFEDKINRALLRNKPSM